MRLDNRRVLLDGLHALIEHWGVELPVVAHAVEDFQVGGYTAACMRLTTVTESSRSFRESPHAQA